MATAEQCVTTTSSDAHDIERVRGAGITVAATITRGSGGTIVVATTGSSRGETSYVLSA
jgi:hypothetical protein